MFARSCITVLTMALAAAACMPRGGAQEPPIPEDLGPAGREQAAESYVQAGLGHLRSGSFEIAQKRFERALRLSPDFYLAHMGLALLYDRTGQPRQAEESFEQALRRAPDNNDLLNNYGQFLCRHGKIGRATELLLASAQHKFNSSVEVPYTNLAVCMINADRRAEAEKYLLLAVRAAPGFASALLPLAKLLFDRGEVAEARDYLQRFESVASHSPLSLWLGLQIEHRLGSREGIETYKFLLRKKFPDSEEAQLLRQSGI